MIDLRAMLNKSETAEEIAEICRLEAEQLGGPFYGECDCCGKSDELSRCWEHGVETYACDECRQ